MTSSERPSPEPILEKKRRPQPYWGGGNSGNALEASNALNYRVWGIPAVLPREIPGNALRAFPGSFRNFSGISSGKSQPYWGYGPTLLSPKVLMSDLLLVVHAMRFPDTSVTMLRDTLSTAGNSLTGSERPSPEPLLKKEASPAVLGGGENSRNALEASNALNYRVWGIPAVLPRGIPGNALRAFPGSFRNFSGISKNLPESPSRTGVWPRCRSQRTCFPAAARG